MREGARRSSDDRSGFGLNIRLLYMFAKATTEIIFQNTDTSETDQWKT